MSSGSQLSVVNPAEPALARAEMKVSVCHIASGDRWAGAEAQIAMLARALRHYPTVDLSAIVLNEGRLAQELRSCGATVQVISEAQHSFVSILKQTRQWLRPRMPDLLHSHGYKANLLAALAAGRQNSVLRVSTQHGLPEPFAGWAGYKQRLMQWTDRMVASQATDRVIGVSDELAGHLARHLDRGKIVTIRNGIDLGRTGSALGRAEARAKLGLGGMQPVIGTAARIEPIKRLDLFLEAAKAILDRKPETAFVIAGEGSELPRLRDVARQLGISRQVHFTGHRDDIFDVLRALDIFLITSDHEGFPTAPLEAMSLGVPVVSRRIGGLAQIVEHGVTGMLIESSDPHLLAKACLQLLDDPVRRNELAVAATHAAAKFDIVFTAAEVLKLYRSLIRERAARAHR